MNTRFLLPACILLAANVLFTAPAHAQNNRPIRLTMTTQYMDRHPIVQQVWLPWIEDMKQRTNGRVQIQYFNPNTLCPDTEVFDAVLKGQVDIGDHLASRNPGILPLNTVMNKVPMISSLAMSGSLAYWDLYNSTPELHAEFQGLEILAMHTTAALQANTNKPVTSLEDLKGLRIIGASKDTMLAISALGLNGIMQPSPDIYLALSRNMGDAVFYPVPPMRSFKINEAVKYTAYADMYIGAVWMGMNQAKWDSLPEDIKEVFRETTGEVMVRAIARALDEGEQEDMTIMEAEGHTFINLSREEKERWGALLEPVLKDAWLKEIGRSNLTDPEALYQKARETMRRYEDEYGRDAVAAAVGQ